MKGLMLMVMLCIWVGLPAQMPIYVLFDTKNPKARYFIAGAKGKEIRVSHYSINKTTIDDCYGVSFIHDFRLPQSVIMVRLDTLKPVVTAEWTANQYDTTLLRFFGKSPIYVIPKDSIKDGRSKAYRVFYQHCGRE